MFGENDPINDKDLNDCEEAIIHLARALGVNEKKIIDIFEDGWKMNYMGTDSEKFTFFLDEMRATHDAY